MARRISPSQLRSKLLQAQSKMRQAQAKHKQAVNKLNQDIRTYNAKARAHNARVRANRARLGRELERLARSASQPQYVRFRTSVETVHRSYTKLERRADADVYGEQFGRFLDLSERETANSVSVMNALQGQIPENETEDSPVQSEIDHILQEISQDVHDRWHGAVFALSPRTPMQRGISARARASY